ncbi:hypothetical protein RGF97_18275 [Streptomyces roseicoloratus]|uniref:Uncharacterized protein n=1 Tax=Streptomyces roseicoloratus TaxID=2508722 RepID=A0ABY9RXA6_9ACTN|nr:hypothetical protein [Streptomyces roseicoloratus]WMX46399.1 hypothetical protein RGF97_18275 [Streptomyces roseicoloratus]
MKKYLPAATAAAAVVAVLAAAPATLAAPAAAPSSASAASAPGDSSAVAPSPSAPRPSARVVASGERVDAGGGFTVWLTEEGKYWTGPDGYENFRSVVDGNVDPSRPGVSHQSEGSAGAGVFHSGLYYGTKKAGKIVLTGTDGTKTTAVLLELPGRPGWGVWYAHTGPENDGGAAVALYDRKGRLLAGLPGWNA